MKRRLLPIFSVACLILAGVLLLGYVSATCINFSPNPTSTTQLSVVFGTVAIDYSRGPAPGWAPMLSMSRPDWAIRWESMWQSFASVEYYREDFPAGTPTIFVAVPLWPFVLLLITPAVVERRRHRCQRAPGFPVSNPQPADPLL